MDDTAYQQFFTQPAQTYQRQYEALRAIFVDGHKQTNIAEQFGYTHGAMRQLVFRFRQFVDGSDESAESPFFETWLPGVARPVRPKPPTRSSPIVGN